MANWVNKLELKDLWEAFDNEKMTSAEVGKEVAKRLRVLPLPDDFQGDQEEIAGMFENEVENEDDFNLVLDKLYDLADSPLPTPIGQMQRKLIWVNTIL